MLPGSVVSAKHRSLNQPTFPPGAPPPNPKRPVATQPFAAGADIKIRVAATAPIEFMVPTALAHWPTTKSEVVAVVNWV